MRYSPALKRRLTFVAMPATSSHDCPTTVLRLAATASSIPDIVTSSQRNCKEKLVPESTAFKCDKSAWSGPQSRSQVVKMLPSCRVSSAVHSIGDPRTTSAPRNQLRTWLLVFQKPLGVLDDAGLEAITFMGSARVKTTSCRGLFSCGLVSTSARNMQT